MFDSGENDFVSLGREARAKFSTEAIDYMRNEQMKMILKDDCFDMMVENNFIDIEFNKSTFNKAFTFDTYYANHSSARTFYETDVPYRLARKAGVSRKCSLSGRGVSTVQDRGSSKRAKTGVTSVTGWLTEAIEE